MWEKDLMWKKKYQIKASVSGKSYSDENYVPFLNTDVRADRIVMIASDPSRSLWNTQRGPWAKAEEGRDFPLSLAKAPDVRRC